MVMILTRLYSFLDLLIDPMHLFKIFYVAGSVLGDYFILSLCMGIANTTAIAWDHGLANYGPQDKPGRSPDFVHEVLLKHGNSIFLHITYDCFCTPVAELGRCNSLSGLQSLKYLLSGPLQEILTPILDHLHVMSYNTTNFWRMHHSPYFIN